MTSSHIGSESIISIHLEDLKFCNFKVNFKIHHLLTDNSLRINPLFFVTRLKFRFSKFLVHPVPQLGGLTQALNHEVEQKWALSTVVKIFNYYFVTSHFGFQINHVNQQICANFLYVVMVEAFTMMLFIVPVVRSNPFCFTSGKESGL